MGIKVTKHGNESGTCRPGGRCNWSRSLPIWTSTYIKGAAKVGAMGHNLGGARIDSKGARLCVFALTFYV